MIVADMPSMTQFVYDLYNTRLELLVEQAKQVSGQSLYQPLL